MGRKTLFAAIAAVLLAATLVVGALLYDHAQEGKIAGGVTIEGVDVGGMDADEAEAKVRRALLRPLDRPLRTVYRERTWSLPAAKLKLRADVGAAVEEAMRLSREGDVPTRLGRYLGGDQLEVEVSADLAYSRSAVNGFVRHVAADLVREARSASVRPGADALEVVASRPGRKLRDVRLTNQLREAVVGEGPRTIRAQVHQTAPEVTTKEVATRFPSYLTLDRANFTLRLWKNLELARTYTVAVGQEGLETPEGLYAIEAMEENPTWHVPESDWAGELAGATIPPGPENPIKARWMAIYEGAGIHGTEETVSLGSAASHGCVRMSIPDVEELYDEVEVGTPVFIG
ncbi:MAG TPA: L,D-transpeptidase family protein [Solirubrobacterales bacterium]|jgi:lipoprotein-anchoring transpeptidase ErfK/SrfK|nr:L,D-transpeptidase family protein [Solirubrobacterales bacterium]